MNRQRKIRATQAQVDSLLKDLRADPAPSVGDHLTDEEFTEYVLELLPREETERADRHLESCPECAAEMERLIEQSAAWSGRAGERRLESLRARVLEAATPAGEPAVIRLRRLASVPGERAAAHTAAEPWESGQGWVGGGSLGWNIHEDEAGDLTIDLSSYDLEEGTRLRFAVGDWYREVGLVRVEPDQVAGMVRISRAERGAMPEGEPLRIEVVKGDG